MDPKQVAACKAVEYARDGMIVGLGTGSTAAFAIEAIGERVADGLKVLTIATSIKSEKLARRLSIEVVSLEDEPVVDLTIDGADEVDHNLDLIKGLGGALLREKIVATASTRESIVVDPSKKVEKLGIGAALPVEVIPFAWPLVHRNLMECGIDSTLRTAKDGHTTYETDNGNFILDCTFPQGIVDPAQMESQINGMAGVVENGLFVGLADIVIVGNKDGTCDTMKKPS